MTLALRPVTLKEARRFVADHHRHNEPPLTWRFGVGLDADGELVGVVIAGIPKARMTAATDPFVLEVYRVCVLDAVNGCSMLYGAIGRAAKALGWRRLVTYTLAEEPGTSLRAAGFTLDAELPCGRSWEDAHPRGGQQHNLFGERKVPTGPKLRWIRDL